MGPCIGTPRFSCRSETSPQHEVGDAYDYNGHHDAVFGDLSSSVGVRIIHLMVTVH